MTLISKVGITTQVTDAIREAIVLSDYEPGEKLSEKQLAEFYNVSRTPVREALKQLDREGLVQVMPRVGTIVAKPTLDELNELFELKESLEGLAASSFAKRIAPEEVTEIEQMIISMEEAVASNNLDLYVEANQQFHVAILEGSRNSKLKYILNLLLNQMPYRSYVHMSIQVPNRLEHSLKEHRDIFQALKSGDHVHAESSMKLHVKASGDELKKVIVAKLYEGE